MEKSSIILDKLRNTIPFLEQVPDRIFFKLDYSELYFPDSKINEVRIQLEKRLGHYVITYKRNAFSKHIPYDQHLCANFKMAVLNGQQLQLLEKYEKIYSPQNISFVVYQKPIELVEVKKSNMYYYAIALQVRQEFENRRIGKNILSPLYESYQQVPNYPLFITQALEMFPRLNCGLASLYLRHILQEGEVTQGKYQDQKHTFLLLRKETVLDITADQYNGPFVYAGPLKEPWAVNKS